MSVETGVNLTEPALENAEVQERNNLFARKVIKNLAPLLSIVATQIACTWPQLSKVAEDVSTFLPSAGFILFGGGLLWAAIYIQGKIQKYQDYSLLLPKKIDLKVEKEQREPGSRFFKKRD